jgi:two-component sensor histidine kinase
MTNKISLFVRKIDDVFIENNTAVPVCLIVTELMFNAYKYAFPSSFLSWEDEPCEIYLCLTKEKNDIVLKVGDNGVSASANSIAGKENRRKGTGLIHGLAEQINADVAVSYKKGTHYTFIFSEKKQLVW